MSDIAGEAVHGVTHVAVCPNSRVYHVLVTEVGLLAKRYTNAIGSDRKGLGREV